ncbi:hypothetical protein SGRIM119S_00001 [Streptomyces griseorubiginosus]
MRVERCEGVAQGDRAALAGVLHLLARVGHRHRLGHRRVGGAGGVRAERLTLADLFDAHTAPHRRVRLDVGPQQLVRLRRVDARRHPQADQGAGARLHGRGGADHRRAVDAEDRDRRAGPDAVGHRAVADQLHPVQDLRVLAELLLVVREALPGRVRGEPVDRGGAVLRAQRVQDPDQRRQRVRGGTAELARVEVALQGVDPDPHHGHAAQGRGHRRQTGAEVARVADDDGVRVEEPGVRLGVPLQAARALLLRALGDELDVHRDPAVGLQGAQREQVHDQPALAVGGPAPVPAAVLALGELEGRGLPARLVQRGLHVVVGVEQDGLRALGARQVAVDRLRAVRGVEQGHVLETLGPERVRDPVRGGLALAPRELLEVRHRPERHQFGELRPRPRHQRGDGLGDRIRRHGHAPCGCDVVPVSAVDPPTVGCGRARRRMRETGAAAA